MKRLRTHAIRHSGIRRFAAAAAVILTAGLLGTTGPVWADDEDSSTFDDGILTYTILSSSTVSVTSCISTATTVSIMPEIDGYDVVSIGEDAFANCTALIGLTIPDSVTEIGEAAFYGCTSLTSLTLPDTVTEIADGTFMYCTALEKLTLGDSVTSIGAMAFGYCTVLTELTLPDTLEELGDEAFYYCTSLETVSIPENLTAFGNYTFYGCLSLSEFYVPATLENMGVMTFLGCPSLSEVTVEEGNPSYAEEDGVLYNTDMDILYLYPAGKSDSAFTVPDSVLVIYAGAFFSAAQLESVTLPDGIQYIGEMAFDFCTNLKNITIPDSVTTIGSTAFADCSALTAVIFADAENDDGGEGEDLYIGDYAFFCCDNLLEVQLPKRVSSIGEYAFGCTEGESEDSDSEDMIVEPVDGFLLIGYTGTAKDYAKNSDISINFKSLDFDWSAMVFYVGIAAAILLVLVIAFRIVRHTMMTAEEKAALKQAKSDQKVPLSQRESETAEEPDDGYRGILDDDDEETETMVSYEQTLPQSRTHQMMGHAVTEESPADKAKADAAEQE